MSDTHAAADPLVDKAVRLFTFLSRAQLLKQRPAQDVEQYVRGGGHVEWFKDLPEHPAIRWSQNAEDMEEPLLTIDRLDREDPPEVPHDIREWILGDVERASSPPRLRPSLVTGRRWDDEKKELVDDLELIEDRDDVRAAFDTWMARWRPWAAEEIRSKPVRDRYKALFGAHVDATQKSEELELVLGIGLLAWHPENHSSVRRHVFTVPVDIKIDERSGQLEVQADGSLIGLRAELDMLEPQVIPLREVPAETERRAQSYSSHAMNREAAAQLAIPLVNALDGHGRYLDELDIVPPTERPTLSWSPALILRPRPKGGLAQAFALIAQQIDEAGAVPAGLRPLLDPDQPPMTQPDPSPGALLTVDTEVFSPLPLNDVQRRILEQVDKNAQTLVQGPPGTGKTHTAAALLSHLLAQGKRVLVTAHTDRALHEVRGKLPDQIRPLAVSVIGASRQDMSDLRLAVDTISRNATEHDSHAADQQIAEILASVEDLRRQRQQLNAQLLDAREKDVRLHHRGSYTGTLATIAQRYNDERTQHEWILELVEATPETTSPITDGEAVRWLSLLRSDDLNSAERDLDRRSPVVADLPSPDDFAALIGRQSSSARAAEPFAGFDSHPAREAVSGLPHELREELQQRISKVVELSRSIEQLRAPWVSDAINDIRRSMSQVWVERERSVDEQIGYVRARTDFLGPNTRVDVSGDAAPLLPLAQSLHAHLKSHGDLKSNVDGTVKIGMFTPGVVKQCKPLFDQVRVDGRAPSNVDLVEKFMAHVEAAHALDVLDRSWPSGTEVPEEDTFVERLAWHVGQLSILRSVLALEDELSDVDSFLRGQNLPSVDWSDGPAVVAYGDLVDAVAAHERKLADEQPVEHLRSVLEQVSRWDDAADWVSPMVDAVAAGDHEAYARAHQRATILVDLTRQRDERDQLTERVASQHRTLAQAVTTTPDAEEWRQRVVNFQAAFEWASIGSWIAANEALDANALQDDIDRIEQHLREAAEEVAAKRAWNHAVNSDRLTIGARADLTQYSQLVRKLGKGTGKYANQQRAEIRKALDRCRAAVPVWIMPIYRVVDQLRISENMFDVVLIDEASQAGLEATFLQYLAPKIIVIGDDKQVSPSAVGVDQQQLRDLADQYLHDDRFKASWQDPQRSLFDEALMRYGGTITLVEHRRCVPEIIGFSNRIAYEPDGIRLVPVRQFGASRLEPIKIVRTPDAFEEGASGSKINRDEARALVDQLKECLDDPSYDGRTMGVISLLGTAQSNLIEKMLLEEVPAEAWAERELQVGAPPDFQGSERDVIFLSMVTSLVPGSRVAALSREMYVQRYNVAVSRAKDQVWVFHSIGVDELTNEQDVRFQLLDYAYGVARRGRDLHPEESPVVPEDQRVEPFDSLFEQRVYNRIIDRGYTVIPQYESQGYRIDLAIVGAKGTLAVECDGDTWHGPDAYASDLARQRDLERCGWTFFRLRESMFYVDRPKALSGLWQLLDDMEIRPSDWVDVDDEVPAVTDVRLDRTVDPTDSADIESTDEHPVETDTATETAVEAEVEDIAVEAPRAEPTQDGTSADWLTRIPEEPLEEAIDSYVSRDAQEVADPPSPATDEPFVHESAPVDDSSDGALAPYEPFRGSTVPVADAVVDEIINGLVQIVGAEGPVRGERLLRAYVLASGGLRVGKVIAKQLNAAVARAERQGRLIMDNPLHQAGVKPRTYRLAHQSMVVTRQLGPRSLEEIPPAELEAIMRVARTKFACVTDEEVMRWTLHTLGRKSLTQTVRTHFEPVLAMLHDHDESTDQEQSHDGDSSEASSWTPT